MNEAIYITQLFTIHWLCAVVGIAEIITTALWLDLVKHKFKPWHVFWAMQLMACALWVIMLKGSLTEQGALITGIIAGIPLVLAWRMRK